jgi:hypothetical protein
MRVRETIAAAATLALVAACGGADAISLACRPTDSGADLAGRASPYDSTMVTIGENHAQVCYSRPSVKGRVIFGGLEPYDSLWRTGANEPTIIHLGFDAEIAGMSVPAGSYSLYTVPGRTQWQVVVNRSTGQWGITRDAPNPNGGMYKSAYTPEVAAQEVGRATVAADSIDLVEQFTIRAEPATGDASALLLEWERTRVRIPIRAVAPPAGD